MPKISRLIIDQQFAAVGIKITHARMQITMPRRRMKINQEMPRMTIKTTRPTFDIDLSGVNADNGMMSPNQLLKQRRSRSEAAAMEYIGDVVAQGDFLSKVEQQGNRVAGYMRQKTLAASDISLNVSPSSLPEVKWNKGSIDISWSNHKFNIEWAGECTPEVIIDPKSSVEIFLRNRPSISITVEEWDTADSAGRLIDAKL